MNDGESFLRAFQAMSVVVVVVLGIVLPAETFWLVCGWIMIGSLVIAVIAFVFVLLFGS